MVVYGTVDSLNIEIEKKPKVGAGIRSMYFLHGSLCVIKAHPFHDVRSAVSASVPVAQSNTSRDRRTESRWRDTFR